jgi:hypothetical protein
MSIASKWNGIGHIDNKKNETRHRIYTCSHGELITKSMR